jgi:hypothetical protein
VCKWRVERLDREHVREGFDCAKASLNDFLHSLVAQYERRNLGRAYVVPAMRLAAVGAAEYGRTACLMLGADLARAIRCVRPAGERMRIHNRIYAGQGAARSCSLAWRAR